MAHFYGKVCGNRGAATRLGTKASALYAVAASWQGSVRVVLYEHHGVDYARVSLLPWQGAGTSRLLYEGPVSGTGANNG